MAVSIRIDPWAADYDGAPAVDEDEGPGGAVDCTVETTEWEAIIPDDVPRPTAMAFVDGVQRTEARVVCDGDGRLSYGALASIGVGCALLENGAARLETQQPVRAL